MKRHTTRGTTLALAALLTTGIAVPLTAGPAAAVTAQERLFYTADTDTDPNATGYGSYGLYREPAPAGTRTSVIPEDTNGQQDVISVASSGDGSRVAFVQDTYSADFSSGHERVGVSDVSGHFVRYVDDLVFSQTSATYDDAPALSPDGKTVVWTQDSDAGTVIKKAPVAAGAATVIAPGYHGATYASPTVLLAIAAGGAVYGMGTDGSSKTAAAGFPMSGLEDLTVSPDGLKVAWTTRTSGTVATVEVADLALVGNAATASNAVPIYSSGNNYAPAFSMDSGSVYFIHNAGSGGDVWKASVDGTTVPAASTGTTAGNKDDVAITTTDNGVAPGTPTVGTASAGISPTLRWSLPSDTDLSYVIVNRYAGTSATGTPKAAYVNAPLTSYVDSGLTAGATYTYTFTAVDRSGNIGSGSAGKVLTALKLTGTFADPTSTNTTRAPFPVAFSTGAPAGTLYYVKYSVNGGGFATWVAGTTGAVRTFGSAATTGVNGTTATPGRTYKFQIQAKDAYGNFTSVLTSGRATVPFDQTSATFSSGTTYTNASSWYGSFRVLKTAGAYAKISIVGDRFQVIGVKCSTCGVFDLYDNGVRVAALDTYRSSTLYRTVLYTRTWSTIGSHTLVIKVRGTAGRPQVALDGFGMRQ